MIEFTNIDNFYSRYVISETYDELHIIEEPRWRCCYIEGGEVGPFYIPNQLHIITPEGEGELEEVTIEGNPKLYQKLCERSVNTVWTTEDCGGDEITPKSPDEEEDDWGETVSENGNIACSAECLNCLRDAIREHESGGRCADDRCNCVGDEELGPGREAYGPYQIRHVYVEDALKACEGYGGSTPCEPCCALRDYLPTPPPLPDPNCMSGCSTQDCRNNCIRKAKAQYIWNLLRPNSNISCDEKEELSRLIVMSVFVYRSQHQSDDGQGSGPNDSMTCEDLARLHNGGPPWKRKKSTQKYWDDKIKPIMQQNCPECVN